MIIINIIILHFYHGFPPSPPAICTGTCSPWSDTPHVNVCSSLRGKRFSTNFTRVRLFPVKVQNVRMNNNNNPLRDGTDMFIAVKCDDSRCVI